MHIRYFSRIQLITVLITTSTLTYLAWTKSPSSVQLRLKTLPSPTEVIIAFGECTNNAEYEESEPSVTSTGWSEYMQRELGHHKITFQNYAQAVSAIDQGVIVNNGLFKNHTTQDGREFVTMSDLKGQVGLWKSNFERLKTPGDDSHEYIVTITLGFWDIWQTAHLNLEEAKLAIMSSIHALFEELVVIADTIDQPITFMLPNMWDISLSPKLASQLSSPDTKPRRFSGDQHKLVQLALKWNTAMIDYASNWPAGDIWIVDWNTWLLDQSRATQVRGLGVFDQEYLGLAHAAFKDVSNPCSKTVFDGNGANGVRKTVQCENPRDHLWWDDTQFSLNAHQLLGVLAAKLLRSNEPANARANVQDPAADSTMTTPETQLVPNLGPDN